MKQEEVFDAFYRDTRDALLHQTFVLTGDLTAASTAVRDAYVRTWHHWDKAARPGRDPLAYARGVAWRLAARRRTARIWHRRRGLAEADRQVLDAVARLSPARRRTLILTDLAELPTDRAARELSMTVEAASDARMTARTQVATSLGRPEWQVPGALRALGKVPAEVTLPRPATVVRAGRKRRRLHTLVATVAGVGVTIGVGVLARQPVAAQPGHHAPPSANATNHPTLPPTVAQTSADQLLDQTAIAALAPKQTWQISRTDNNMTGDGINTICQQSRFADPRGLASLVRVFHADGKPDRSAVQTLEVSRDASSARDAYDTELGWFAGCQEARLQLLEAYRIRGVGDQASLLMLQSWNEPQTSYAVAVARLGSVTTTVVATTVAGGTAAPGTVARTLGTAVGALCPTSICVSDVAWDSVPPPPSGEQPGMLAVVDLPPVGSVMEPWVGVDAVSARSSNPAATTCDRTDFGGSGVTQTMSRTYLIPQADVPERFGLAETYGTFRSDTAATSFLATVRDRMANCETHDITSTVTDESTSNKDGVDTSIWSMSTKVSDQLTVRFRVGIVRVGDKVAEVTLAPSDTDDMTTPAFTRLVLRAGERLRELS